MTFKVSRVSLELIDNTATLIASDRPSGGVGGAVRIDFDFKPVSNEGPDDQRKRIISEAKQVLQQALGDI